VGRCYVTGYVYGKETTENVEDAIVRKLIRIPDSFCLRMGRHFRSTRNTLRQSENDVMLLMNSFQPFISTVERTIPSVPKAWYDGSIVES
jgi:hypothetical protein